MNFMRQADLQKKRLIKATINVNIFRTNDNIQLLHDGHLSVNLET